MRVVHFYGDIQKVDAEQRMVWGYASTEAVDADGETILKSAVEEALEDYLKWANIREMHKPSAVGTAEEAMVDDKGLYLGAKIVDDAAWAKVQAGVYKGFSIGGKTLARDPKHKKTITKVALHEISLVDRPSNPEARFDVWKAAGVEQEEPSQPEADSDDIAKSLADVQSRIDEIVNVYNARFDALETGRDNAVRKVAGGVEPLLKAVAAIRDDHAALIKRIAQLEAQPLPPKTTGAGGAFIGITKDQDSVGHGGQRAPAPSTDDVAKMLAAMAPDDRAHLLTKAALASPVGVSGYGVAR